MTGSDTPHFDAALATNDVVAFRLAFADIAGDVVAGLLLSQLAYWTTRATVERDGHLWIVKTLEAWWDECRLTPHQARRALAELVKRGLAETATHKFHGIPTSHIRLIPEAMETALATLPTRDNRESDLRVSASPGLARERESNKTETLKETTPLSLLALSAEPDPSDPFDEFWSAYPKKADKDAARKAWASRVKHGADPRRIIEAAHRYRADPVRKPEFTKNPASWLNAGSYNNQPAEPTRPRLSNQDAFLEGEL